MVVRASSFLAYVKAFRLIYLNERVARPLFVFVELNERARRMKQYLRYA